MTDEQDTRPLPPASPPPPEPGGAQGVPGRGADQGNRGDEPPSRLAFTRRRFIVLLAGAAAALAGVEELVRRFGGGQGSVGTTGSRNPHGLAGQDFPTLQVEDVPRVSLRDWTVQIAGLVAKPVRVDYTAWSALPRTEETVDFHCVEGWSVRGVRWGGVRPKELLAQAQPLPTATHAVFHAYDGSYSDSLSMDQVNDPHTLLADSLDGEPLPAEHGGPLRLAVPTQLGYKNVKWVRRIELVDHEVKGYWEQRGYPVDAPVS